MDPVDRDLRVYLSKQSRMDSQDEWVAAQVEYLMSEGEDYYPMNHDNIMEALCQAPFNYAETVAVSVAVAEATPTPEAYANLARAVLDCVNDYWEYAAQRKAELDFQDLEPDYNEPEECYG